RLGIKALGAQFGPAPRSMDRFSITVDPGGKLIVDTSKITLGPLPVAVGQPGIIPPKSPVGCICPIPGRDGPAMGPSGGCPPDHHPPPPAVRRAQQPAALGRGTRLQPLRAELRALPWREWRGWDRARIARPDEAVQPPERAVHPQRADGRRPVRVRQLEEPD